MTVEQLLSSKEFAVERRKAERLIAWFARHQQYGDPHPGYRALMFTLEQQISIQACRKMYEMPDTRTELYPEPESRGF